VKGERRCDVDTMKVYPCLKNPGRSGWLLLLHGHPLCGPLELLFDLQDLGLDVGGQLCDLGLWQSEDLSRGVVSVHVVC
jgi:hypothetical protein